MTGKHQAPVSELLQRGYAELQQGRARGAAEYCRRAIALEPASPQAHFLVGLTALELGDLKTAAQGFGSVTKLEPENPAAWAQLARLFMRLGQPARAERALDEAKRLDPSIPVVADLIGVVSSMLGDQRTAEKWYRRACEAAPENAEHAVNLASALMFLGENDEAARILENLFENRPDIAQAQWLYSSLRRQKDASRPQNLLARARTAEPQDAAFLAYAAGKEFEDCGDWPAAFEAFSLGAKAKRSTVDFDEAAEEQKFADLAAVFDEYEETRAGCDDPSPIFVIGQPRTGTTLIERIITSHPAVESAGELQQFRLSVSRLARPAGATHFDRAQIAEWRSIDPLALGLEYLRASMTMRKGAERFVDKLPGNYIHVPLILAALPNAKIVHLTREPMDACFASFKQLFAETYLHSYDQLEMARHFARYQKLMDVWRRKFDGRILDISYEETVSDLEPNARRLIDYLGLPWNDACLRFHEQDGPVATASAVQVREKPHTRSVGRWRRYGSALDPMREELERCGVAVAAERD